MLCEMDGKKKRLGLRLHAGLLILPVKRMKLRRCFPPRQLLFLLAISALLVRPGGLRAQDTIVMKDGKIQPAKILGVAGSTVQVQVGGGSVGIPIANIEQVNMPPPPEFATATSAFQAKDFPKAQKAIQAILDKYRGLPAPWAERTMAMVGDIYVETGELGRAETAYKDFQRIYPGGGSVQAEVGLARIAVAKKDFDSAKRRLEPILAQALKAKDVPRDLGAAYSDAFYVSGQIKEAQGDTAGALEDYLRTVAIFYHDRLAVASAQERADALRKDQGVVAP